MIKDQECGSRSIYYRFKFSFDIIFFFNSVIKWENIYNHILIKHFTSKPLEKPRQCQCEWPWHLYNHCKNVIFRHPLQISLPMPYHGRWQIPIKLCHIKCNDLRILTYKIFLLTKWSVSYLSISSKVLQIHLPFDRKYS